jgi:hypothetical protein
MWNDEVIATQEAMPNALELVSKFLLIFFELNNL